MRVSEEVELSPADKDKIRVCIPDGANVEQVLKVILKFIEENPERSHNPTRHFGLRSVSACLPLRKIIIVMTLLD